MWKEWKSFGRGKCLLGLVGERLPSNNPIFYEKKIYICGEQFLLGEFVFVHT